MTQSTTN